jgi:hypothetical protein
VNLVREKAKKEDLDLTIDEILKESEYKESAYELGDSLFDKLKDESNIKRQEKERRTVKKDDERQIKVNMDKREMTVKRDGERQMTE